MKKGFVLLLILALLAACTPKPALDPSAPYVDITFTYGEGLRYPPSYAIWAQDEAGNKTTLFVSRKSASKRFVTETRPATLPIWAGIREESVDAVSGATPSSGLKLQRNLPESMQGKPFTLFIEANASYDYNDYYSEGLKKGDEGYNDVNGQPSVLWSAAIDGSRATVTPVLIGRGDVTGADHLVHEDMDSVTSAKELLRDIVVTVSQGE